MKKTLLTLILFVSLFIKSSLFAQISSGGTPYSFNLPETTSNIDEVLLPAPNLIAIKAEDALTDNNGNPHRFAVAINTDFNIKNSGEWTELKTGGKIWRLNIKVKGALALGLNYNEFELPKGSKLFIYNETKTQVIGAFTHYNNPDNGVFATELIQGESIIIEYYEPLFPLSEVKLNISGIAYAYRDVNFLTTDKGFGDSGNCQVNINCSPEGDNWQDEKRGVARISILLGGSYFWCTGSLLNNIREDCTPYFLTADHCGGSATPTEFNQWIFYFNYEAAGCANPGAQPSSNTIVGSTFRANGGNEGATGSDFLLLELNSVIPDFYGPYYNGWDANNTTSSGGVGIHHPAGDIKKISTQGTTTSSSQWNGNGVLSHWRLTWAATANGTGVSEGGSSGSPLFNSLGRVVGSLTGGSSTCTNPTWPDYYGKMSYHWESNGVNANEKLKPWLDPDNTGALVLDGTNQPCGNNPPTADFTADATTVLVGGTVNFSDQSSGATSWDWTFSGGTPNTATATTNPSITYNTIGVYDVSLTVTNTNGSDIATKTAYITVIDQMTTCNTLHYPLNYPAIYSFTSPNGYATGTNAYNFTAVADYFSGAEIVGYDRVESASFLLGKITGTTTTVDFTVWADAGGLPGAILGTVTKPLSALNAYAYNTIDFVPPISFTGPFFVGVTLPDGATGDTLVVYSDTSGAVSPGTAYYEYTGAWNDYETGVGLTTQLGIFPYVCPFDPLAAPVANFYGTPQITFINEPVNFFDLSINDPTSWNWTFNSGAPATSTLENPTGIIWSVPGFYDVSLTATNSNGSGSDTKINYIEVREHTCENITTAYTMGFEAGEDVLEWLIEDANTDGFDWGYYSNITFANGGTNYAACFWNNDALTPSDDWLFTKCLTLEAGINYQISFYYRARSATYPQQMEVWIGDAQASVNMTTSIVNLGSFSNDTYIQSVTSFTVPINGNYYIGFHDYSVADMWGILLDDINIDRFGNPPTADFVSDFTQVCVGETVSFADASLNSPTTWDWTFAGGTPGTSTGTPTPTITYNTAGTYDVTLSVTNAYGSDIITKTTYITVNDLPIVTLGAFSNVCVDAASFTLTGGSPVGGTYSGTGVSAGNFDPTIAGVGTHTITYTYMDGNGCTNTANQTITVNPLPTVTFGILSDVCVDAASFTLTGGSPVGGTYSGIGVSAGNFNPTTAGVGIHTITYTYTDGNGCTNSANQTITVNSLPIVTFAVLSDVCVDAPSFALSGGSPAGGTYSGTGVSGGNFNPATAGVGTHIITYTYTDGNSCTNSANQTITVNSLPTVDAGINQSIPYNTSTTINATVSGGSGSYTYSWSPPGLLLDASIEDPTTVNLTASSIYTLIVTDVVTGCTNSDVVTITVTGGPLAVTTSATPTTICEGESSQLVAIASGGTGTYTYSWTSVPVGFTSSIANPVVSPTTTTTYTVSVNDGVTIEVSSVVVTVNPLPTVTLSVFADVCVDATPYTLTGGSPVGGTYTGTGVSAGSFNPATAGVGTHTITYTYMDGNGCTDIATETITVNDLPTVTLNTFTDVCVDATSFVLSGGSPIGGIYSGTGVSGGNFDPATAGIGTHSITYTYIDVNTCTSSDIQSITVNATPSATIVTVNASCGSSDGTATANATGGTGSYTYLWDVNANSQTSATATGLQAGSYNVTISDGNCIYVTSGTVIEDAAPVVTIIQTNDTICDGQSVTITASGADTYIWTPATGLNTTTGSIVVATPSSNITYTVEGTTAGCSIFETASIVVEYPPTAGFTFVDNLLVVDFTNTSVNADSYTWNFGDSNTSIAVNPSHTYATGGSYNVELVATNNCGNDTVSILVDVTVGINSTDIADNALSIYPNPNKGSFKLKYSSINNEDLYVQVINMTGQKVFAQEYRKNHTNFITTINLNGFAKGVYQIQLVQDTKIYNTRIVIDRY